MTQAFLRPGDDAVYSQHAFAVYPLADAGARRDRHRGAGARLRARPAGDARRDHAARRASCSSPIRTIRPARGSRPKRCARSSRRCRATSSSCSTRPTTSTSIRREHAPSAAWIADATPNLVVSRTFSKALRPGGAARRLRRHGRQRRRHAEPRAPAVQRQRAGAGGGARGARRHRLRRGEPRAQRRGHARSSRTALRRSACRYVPSHGNFVLATSAMRRAVYRRAAAAGRDRAPGRQLRPAGVAARHRRPARGEPRASSMRSRTRSPADPVDPHRP